MSSGFGMVPFKRVLSREYRPAGEVHIASRMSSSDHLLVYVSVSQSEARTNTGKEQPWRAIIPLKKFVCAWRVEDSLHAGGGADPHVDSSPSNSHTGKWLTVSTSIRTKNC